MGAFPYAYTLSLCLSNHINAMWLKKFSNKLFNLQKKYNFFLIGGDLSKSEKIVISSNFFGFSLKGKILKRIGAKIDDDIWVTGNIGESTIGLMIKQKKIKTNNNDKKYFLKKYLYPSHCFFGEKIYNLATSAIDISDGLLGDLQNLINYQKIGASLETKFIPFSTMDSVISLVPMDPYKVPSSETGTSIFKTRDSSFLASSKAASFLTVSAFKRSSLRFSYSALFSSSALIALPVGIKKFLP